jgi:hypothetical protein
VDTVDFCELWFVFMDHYSHSSSALLLLTREGDVNQGLWAFPGSQPTR